MLGLHAALRPSQALVAFRAGDFGAGRKNRADLMANFWGVPARLGFARTSLVPGSAWRSRKKGRCTNIKKGSVRMLTKRILLSHPGEGSGSLREPCHGRGCAGAGEGGPSPFVITGRLPRTSIRGDPVIPMREARRSSDR